MFTHARSQSPWTLSSLASLLTSTYPSVNAVLTGNNRLEKARTTIAEAMQQEGILTQAIVSNGWLQNSFGMAQGFEGYHHSAEVFNLSRFQRMIWLRIARKLRPDLFPIGDNFLIPDLVDMSIEWLQKYHDRDFFLWIHSIDPHDPYQPPEEYRRLYAEEPYKGRFQVTSGQIFNLRIGARLSVDDKAQLERLYDQEIRYTDDHFKRLIDTLNRLGIGDETFIIISSDHGEEFWEHDGLMHGHALYDEQLLVPLVMHFPDRISPGLVIDKPVRLLDLMPTILDMYDFGMPSEMQGTSMIPLIQNPELQWAAAPSYAEALLYFDELKSVAHEGYKLVLNPSTGKTMLFDLSTDPGEQIDLKWSQPELAETMRLQLEEWLEESERLAESLPHSTDGSKANIDPETEAQLKALGYLH
jgi:arylsulfatase A-like enzyme